MSDHVPMRKLKAKLHKELSPLKEKDAKNTAKISSFFKPIASIAGPSKSQDNAVDSPSSPVPKLPGANGTENEKIGNDSTIIAGNKSNPSTSTPIPPATSDNIESFTMPTTPIMPTTPVESDSIQDAGRLAPSPALFSTPRSLRINESYVSINENSMPDERPPDFPNENEANEQSPNSKKVAAPITSTSKSNSGQEKDIRFEMAAKAKEINDAKKAKATEKAKKEDSPRFNKDLAGLLGEGQASEIAKAIKENQAPTTSAKRTSPRNNTRPLGPSFDSKEKPKVECPTATLGKLFNLAAQKRKALLDTQLNENGEGSLNDGNVESGGKGGKGGTILIKVSAREDAEPAEERSTKKSTKKEPNQNKSALKKSMKRGHALQDESDMEPAPKRTRESKAIKEGAVKVKREKSKDFTEQQVDVLLELIKKYGFFEPGAFPNQSKIGVKGIVKLSNGTEYTGSKYVCARYNKNSASDVNNRKINDEQLKKFIQNKNEKLKDHLDETLKWKQTSDKPYWVSKFKTIFFTEETLKLWTKNAKTSNSAEKEKDAKNAKTVEKKSVAMATNSNDGLGFDGSKPSTSSAGATTSDKVDIKAELSKIRKEYSKIIAESVTETDKAKKKEMEDFRREFAEYKSITNERLSAFEGRLADLEKKIH